jgi:hypothetical protein
MATLDAMLAHHCDNAFFDMKFGHNPFAITLTTPLDMMHLFESGIVKRVCQTFVDSMSTNIRVRVDNLMETLFRLQRKTLSNSQNFLCTNFCGGATRLTMLSSHHWPGMMFTFLLLLLTPRGAEICSSCFLNKDIEESNYDWDSAPRFDLDNVYKPPILHHQVNHGHDIRLRSTGKDDDEVQEPEEVPANDCSSDSSEADSAQHHVTNNNKGPVTMNCSHCQFVYLLENLLLFHAMYKCGQPFFGPGSSPSDADNFLLSLHKLVVQISTFYPRQEGNKWKLQKLHELLHFPLMLFFFHHAENFDAGTRERHLQDIARNSQQRGQDTFLCQVGARMHEKLIMTKAKQFSVGMAEYYSGKHHNRASPTNAGNEDITHTLPHNKMYVISYHETNHTYGRHTGGCTARLTGMNPSTQIHPVILSWLADNWEIEIGGDQESIECYMEMKVKEGSTYHAHLNYHSEVSGKIVLMAVSFGRDEQGVFQIVPSRILFFYIHHFVDDNGDQSDEIRALVQTCDYQVGSNRARWLRMDETHLCSRWQLSMKHGSSQDEVRVNVRELYSVSAKDLKSPVLVFEENPGLCESWRGKRYVWSVRDRRTEWSHMFPLLDD